VNRIVGDAFCHGELRAGETEALNRRLPGGFAIANFVLARPGH